MPEPGFCPDRGLFALPGSLPEADVIHQLVNVLLDLLLTLGDAPDLDAMLDEPLQNEGRFVVNAP
ncbi:hypothetical protein SDC9_189767 [bioreactor metagenome]|uniref:Uncharacterized protein n=1 Tax=bioreactor metagenome TaxID=1076179 RepID=A0A645HT42_9ZZZZ